METKDFEIWKDVKNYEGIYKVSNLGRVMSLNYMTTHSPQLLMSQVSSNGYAKIKLHKNGKRHYTNTHRLVAEAFLNNPYSYSQINHKDENKLNNCVENLEWCTPKYNSNYGKRNEKLRKKVFQINKEGIVINIFESTVEVQRVLGIKHQNVSSCCRGEIKSAGGYKWTYIIKK